MFDISQVNIFAYALVAFFLVITPGTDVLLVLSTALRARAIAGVITSFGVCLGSLLWAALAGVGLVTVLQTYPLIFNLLTLFGIAYIDSLQNMSKK